MSALFGSPPLLVRLLAILMVAAVIALVAWALQLMQAANDRQEFSLMLAGCMVCSAAVGLSTVMVLTFTSSESVPAHPSATSALSLYATPWKASLPTVPLPETGPWEGVTRLEIPSP